MKVRPMPDETDKNLPYVSEYTDGSFHPWAWGPEQIMKALNLVYRRQAEILDLLRSEKTE